MERLSERLQDVVHECIDAWSQVEEDIVTAAIKRLAAYEDTGVVPAQLSEIQTEAYDLGYQSCLNYKGLSWTEAEELQRYRETGLKPEQIKDMAENAETRLLTWFESQYGYSVGVLMDLLDAKKAGRLLVLDEETALAIAAGAHGCNTNKRLFGASYMRNFRSDNPQSISYYRAIEILTEIAEKALEGGSHE